MRRTAPRGGGVDGDIEIRTEIVVSPEDDVELRRVSLTNHGREARSFDLTSYAEVVLAPGDADLAHPAFSNLFVETIAVPERDALMCVRRPRSGTDRLYLIHVLSGRGRARRRDGVRDGSRRGSSAAARGVDRPAALVYDRAAVEHHRARARSDRQPAAVGPHSAGRDGPHRVHDRICRQRRRRAAADREVSRPAGGGARARAGEHAQPDRAASPRAHHRGDDAVPAPVGPADVRRSAAAVGRCRAAEHARPGRAVEIRDLRRPADPARAPQGRQRGRRCCAICSRRTSICGARGLPSISSC